MVQQMNDLNLLMSYIAEINTKPPIDLTPTDIDRLIAYHRQMRARRAAGEKTTKPALERAKPALSLSDLLSLGPSPTTPAITSDPSTSSSPTRR